MTAKSGLDEFKEFYEAAGEGKEDFAFIDIGINDVKKILIVEWLHGCLVA